MTSHSVLNKKWILPEEVWRAGVDYKNANQNEKMCDLY
jgi:hypothetical protein